MRTVHRQSLPELAAGLPREGLLAGCGAGCGPEGKLHLAQALREATLATCGYLRIVESEVSTLRPCRRAVATTI